MRDVVWQSNRTVEARHVNKDAIITPDEHFITALRGLGKFDLHKLPFLVT